MKWNRIIFLLVAMFASKTYAADKFLVTMPGPTPSLAKSYKNLGPGKAEFILDLKKPISKGKLSFDLVKKTLEKRLKKFKATVSGSKDKVIVSYSGDEKAFLKKVSKVWIKDRSSSSSIGLESSVSSGGVRARTAVRAPSPQEVKGTVTSVSGSQIKVMVLKKGGEGMTAKVPSYPIKVETGTYKARKGQSIYFKPVSKNGDVWQGEGFTDK